MTHFDAGAAPMHAAFQAAPDLAPYTAEKPRVALDERNPAASPTAARSSRLAFSPEGLADDNELNDILWLAVRGRRAPPAPTPRCLAPINIPPLFLIFHRHSHPTCFNSV